MKRDCPVEDFTCPYWKNGICELDNAEQECDAFYGLDEETDY